MENRTERPLLHKKLIEKSGLDVGKKYSSGDIGIAARNFRLNKRELSEILKTDLELFK